MKQLASGFFSPPFCSRLAIITILPIDNDFKMNPTNTPIIAKAVAGDLPAILQLQHLAYQSESALFGGKTIPPLQQTLDDVVAEFNAGIVLKMVDSAGVIIGSVRARENAGTVYVGKLMVHPECRHCGYGTMLLLEIEKYCLSNRYELFTSTRSTANIRLYERNGYKIFDRKIVDGDLEFVFMEKFLNKV